MRATIAKEGMWSYEELIFLSQCVRDSHLADLTARKSIKAFSVTETNVCLVEQVM